MDNQPSAAQQTPPVTAQQQKKRKKKNKNKKKGTTGDAGGQAVAARPRAVFKPPPRITVPKPPPPQFTVFNNLPNEIQKNIFEIAYHLSWRETNWACISRKVREWIEPLIYESIVLPEDFQGHARSRLESYERTFRLKPKEFYTKSVRSIYTNNNRKYPGSSSDFEVELLSICDNITNLECWSDPCDELKALLRTKSFPKLQNLCIDIDLLPKDENVFRLPIFGNTTHLDITSEQPQLPSWESLQSLEQLTHMRAYMLVKTQDFGEVMDQTYAIAVEAKKFFPPDLKYFVIIVPVDLLYQVVNRDSDNAPAEDNQRWERMESIRRGTFDPRVIMGFCGLFDDDLDHWPFETDEEGCDKLVDYLKFVPQLKYPNFPRSDLGDDEITTWEEVEDMDKLRRQEWN